MKENKIKLVLKFAVLLVVSLFTAFPFIWMILSALKTKAEIMNVGCLLYPSPNPRDS